MADYSAEQLISAIFGQESNSGRADTSKPNYAGAIGPMQVIEPTFNGLKKQGVIPADWSFTNPAHTQEAGNRLVRQLHAQYGGDARKVAAAYYSGPKAVGADGEIISFRDPKNLKAPDTFGYVDSIMYRLGGAPSKPATLVPRPAYQRLADPLQEVMPERMQAGPGEGTGKKPVDLTMQPEVPARPVDRVAEAGAAEKVGLAQAAKENVPFLEMSQRALMTGFEGSLIRLKVARDILGDNPVDPQYKVDPKLLRGLTEAEQDHMLGAVSQRDEDHRKFSILDNRESQEIQSARGQGWAMAAGVVAGLPLGAVTGLGAARAMSLFRAGSAQLMAQGRTGAAVASSLGENAVVEGGLAALQYKIDPFFTASDAVTQMSLGTLLSSAVAAPSLLREGRASARLTTLQDAQSAQRIQDTQAVEARLGPDADPAILTQQVRRLEEERAVQTVDSMRSKPPEPMLGEDQRPDFEPPELAASSPAPVGGNLTAASDPTRRGTVLPATGSAPMRTWEQLARTSADPAATLAAAPWARSAVEAGDIHVLPAGSVLPDYPNAVAAYSSKLRKTFVVDGARPEDMRSALLGSYGAQHGLAGAVGDAVYSQAMEAVAKLATAGNKTAAEIMRRVPGNTVEDMEFRLGLFVEAYPKNSAVTRMLDALRGWWGKLTGELDMTPGDLLRVIEGSVKSKRGDIVAFSGGPRNFEAFSTEYVGTGEGNISQGWGLYFSESSGVADWYRKKESLSRGGSSGQGVTYKVSIARRPDEFLDWKGNSSAEVKRALAGLGLRGDGEMAYRELMGRFSGTKGEQAKQASGALSAAGIAGTSYKAGGGRVNATNYVAYSDKDVKIAQKFMGGAEATDRSLAKDTALRATLLARVYSAISSVFRKDDFGKVGRRDTSFEGWDSADVWADRGAKFSPGGKLAWMIPDLTFGKFKTLADLDALPPGIHVVDRLKNYGNARKVAEALVTKFLGKDFKLVIADADATLRKEGADGAITHIRENLAIINVDLKLAPAKLARVMIHEIGHAIWHKFVGKLTPQGRGKVDAAFQRFLEAKGAAQSRMRFANTSSGATMKGGQDMDNKYIASRDEFSAEQMVKYVEDDILNGGNSLQLDRSIVDSLFEAVAKVIAFFKQAGQKGFVKAEAEYEAMFDSILRRQAAENGNFGAAAAGIADARTLSAGPETLPSSQSKGSSPLDEKESIALDPDMQRLGLTIAPMETPQQRAEVVAMKDLHVKAEKADIQVDETRLSKLLDTALFQGGQSTANVLLRSKNAVARHFSAMMVENPSGAAGRRPNAAIAKHLHEQAFIGNTINDVQRHYYDFRREAGGNLAEDVFGGKNWEDFNKKIARELEARGRGTAVTSHPAVIKAADSLELAYERMRVAQVNAQTVGSANLPASSKGYMPHRMSNERIRNATNQQLAILHSAMTDQFIMKLDFDPTFSDMLASKYIDRVKNRALGGADSPVGAGHIGSSELVEEALEAAGMTRDQIRATMKKLVTAGPGHTKTRLKLDLNAEHALPDGGTFRLGDLFEDDQFTLLRSQAARVSGEVALTEFGVFGKAGLDVIRRAMQFGEHGAATRAEFDAFDQIAAELLGTPYGTQSKLVDRVLQANAVVRLGGIVWNQGAETINAMWHVGAGRTLDSIIGIPRLLGEVRALARGEAVPNGILEGLEKVYGGAEFGTLSYKTVFPFDNRSMDPHSYGEETITFMDRLLRGASHMQAKLSFWRAVHSAQQRGMAEQIVRKAAVFLKEGRTADIFLKDMGLSDDLIQRMSAELPRIATWDASGRLLELDVTKATDLDAAREFAQVVHRGVSQIIQGTFIGERSKWATDSHMRLLTQFRTFGLTAIEKQYGRQVGNVGEVKALGILLGSMCMSLPIYAARMQVQAMGREDHEEFLERAFQPERVARQSLNYVAGSGLSGDLLDALGALSGADLGGGRTGKEQDFVGNLVLPAAGLFNDAYKGLQNTQEGTDPEKLMKSLPLSNLPYLAPLIRALGED